MTVKKRSKTLGQTYSLAVEPGKSALTEPQSASDFLLSYRDIVKQ